MFKQFRNTDHLVQIQDQGKDALSFKDVFHQYYASLCYFTEKIVGSPDDAEDIVNEVFFKLWNHASAFENHGHLRSFLYKTTRNASLDHLKKATHEKERQLVFLTEHDDDDVNYTNQIIQAEVLGQIYQEIKNLPGQCGKIVSMSYIDGLKNEDIASKLGLSLQTVKNQKSRGISLLKIRLSSELFIALLLLSNRR